MNAIWKCAINSTKTRKTKMHALPLGDLIPECVQQGETETRAHIDFMSFRFLMWNWCSCIVCSQVRHPPPPPPAVCQHFCNMWLTHKKSLHRVSRRVCQGKVTNFPLSTSLRHVPLPESDPAKNSFYLALKTIRFDDSKNQQCLHHNEHYIFGSEAFVSRQLIRCDDDIHAMDERVESS